MKRFLSKKQVRAIVLLSNAEIDRREKDGKFPRRIRLGPYSNSRVGWLEDEILAWVQAQIDLRDNSM